MPNRHVINETIAAYANAAIDGANAAGGKEAVVEIRYQMLEILGFMASNIDLRLACDDEGLYPSRARRHCEGSVWFIRRDYRLFRSCALWLLAVTWTSFAAFITSMRSLLNPS